MTQKHTAQPIEERRLLVSVPTRSGRLPGFDFAPLATPLTEAEITKAMQSAGVSMGIDNLAPDMSKSMNVSIAHPMVPNRLLLQVFKTTAGVWNFDGGSGATFHNAFPVPGVPPQVRLRLRPVSDTIYLFDFSAVIGAAEGGSFIYEIFNEEGLDLEGEAPEIDGHGLFAVQAPSAAELTIRIHAPYTWYFYNCQVIPQT